jgi:hypothetical protein
MATRTIRYRRDSASSSGQVEPPDPPPARVRAWYAGETREMDEQTAAWLVERGIVDYFDATGLAAGAVTSSSVGLSWTPLPVAASYQVQSSTDGGVTWADVAAGSGGTPTTASTTVSGLTASTTYGFRVLAVDSEGARSVPSAPVTATTAALI